MKRKQITLLSVAAIALLALTAGASAYIVTEMNDDTPVKEKVARVGDNIKWNNSPVQQPATPPERVASNCDDGNIVGTAIGGVGGGVAGSQFGKGDGKTAATIGGAVVGGYLGNQFIPTRNVTCPK